MDHNLTQFSLEKKLQQNAPVQITEQNTQDEMHKVQDHQALNAQTLTNEEKQKTGFESKEDERWAVVEAFHKKSGEVMAQGSHYNSEYGSMDIFELRDVLKADSKSKSELFETMFNGLDNFLKLSATSGKIEFDTAVITSDFGDSLFAAKQAVHNYLTIRSGQKHFYENGKRRLDIARRIECLLDDMTTEINKKVEALPDK